MGVGELRNGGLVTGDVNEACIVRRIRQSGRWEFGCFDRRIYFSCLDQGDVKGLRLSRHVRVASWGEAWRPCALLGENAQIEECYVSF
jgi:hypothetical protein